MLPLIPLLAALAIAQQEMHVIPLAWPQLAAWTVGGLAAWGGLCSQIATRAGTQRNGRWLAWWEALAPMILLGAFALLCIHGGWASAVSGSTAAVAPFLIGLLMHWFTLGDGVRRLTGLPWTRWSFLDHQVRLTALPVFVIISLIVDASERICGQLMGQIPLWLQVVGFVCLMIGAATLAPPLLIWLWRGTSLPAGAQRDQLEQTCRTAGASGARLLMWPQPYGRFYNAAVVGFFPRWRYVLMSSDLLRDLPPEQLDAVLGHELGHSRHRHVLVLMLFFLTALTVGFTAAQAFHTGWLPLPWDRLPVPPEYRSAVIAVFGIIVMWRICFGWISRLCERQADLAGADLVRDPRVMAEALKTVARLSGQRDDAPNWRHYSIRERAEYLDRVATNPHLASNHHRRMRFSLVLLIMVMLSALALNLWLSPSTKDSTPADAQSELATWTRSDADLASALTAADAGDPTTLTRWYQGQPPRMRQVIVALHLSMTNLAAPGAGEIEVYRLRRRFSAFSGIDTGRDELNLWLDNTLAYALTAGTETPNAVDLEQAGRLVPNLETAVLAKPEHAIFDTIGCVHFRLGHFAKSRDAFANALSQLHEDRTAAIEPLRARLEALYASRRTAAESALHGTTGVALPREGQSAAVVVTPSPLEPTATDAPAALP